MRNTFSDLRIIDSISPITALVLVDTEPNEEVLEILRGYENLRRVSQRLLREVFPGISDATLQSRAQHTPDIRLSINEHLARGKDRDALKQHCRSNNIMLIPYKDTFSEAKTIRLATCLPYSGSPWILLADLEIPETTAEEIHLALWMAAHNARDWMFFWESRHDGRPHIVILAIDTLSDNELLLLNPDNDGFIVHKRAALFGGFECAPLTASLPKKKYKFSRSEITIDVRGGSGWPYTLQHLVDGLLFEASKRGLRVVHGLTA